MAQKAELEVELFVSCIKDLGNDTLVAYFGYENPNPESITVQLKKSYIAYNYTRDIKYVISTFEPGVHDKVFSQEFRSDDWVRWTVKFSNYTKLTRADSTSSVCLGELPVIPGYQPPEGGKEYDSKIGAELTALYEAYDLDPNFSDAPEDIFQINGNMVFIEVVANSGQYEAMLASLTSLGFELYSSDPELNRATGWIDISNLLLLNEIDALHYARPVYPGVSNYIVPPTGLTKSQGDFSMHSDFARLGYEIDGSGVKIGVLSNSYNTKGGAALDIENGDLPGPANINGFLTPVDVLLDLNPAQGTLSDEGRAMLQIIHDIAPGAELAFRTGYLGEQDMAEGIRQLANEAGCDIIVDDLSYITEPFFRDGVVSQAIDEVVAQGVTFISSAGNFGNASYTALFDPEPAPITITGEAHDFSGSGDIFQGVLLEEGSYTLVLQWDDNSDPTMNTTSTDLDIFLSDDVGFSLLGFNRENVGAFPIEVVPFSVQGESVQVNIVVARASGSVPVTFKYMLFRGGSLFQMLEYSGGSSTIVGHPNAAGAISVGAVRFDKNPIYNPSEYPVPVIMSFSSIGGTPVNGVVRAKPDCTAPNGVNTTVDLGNGDWDDPIDPDTEFPNFFGTSAASPHAAGMAALLIEAGLKFQSEVPLTPEEIRTLMKSTTIEKLNGGVDDFISGSGFIQTHKALMTFANPTPYVENLILASEGGIPGEEITPFSFTVEGDFFTDDTEVLFRGESLDGGVVIVDESTITVDHEGFIGNPEVQVYNPSISASGEDGGYSDPIYFSDPVKLNVTITADSYTKKYGEVLPVFTANIIVETLEGTSLTLAEAVTSGIVLQEEADRLTGLSFAVAADANSNAGQYIIVPTLDPVLDVENPQTEIDNAIVEKYILEFVNGTLTIEKLALTITPNDVEMVYGENLPGDRFTFSYEIENPDFIDDIDLILNGAEQEHTAALTNEVALIRGIALVNGIPMIRGVALVNGVTMIRGIALVNGVEVRVEEDGTVFVAGEPVASGGPLVRGIALVNDLPFVNMTEIVRGIALVNGEEVTCEDGYMTELNGIPLPNAIKGVRGTALVNGSTNIRGIALVNGVEVIIENGITTIDGASVPTEGIVEVNGIPVVRGIALVNSSFISRGIALVNDVEVPIENGLPKVRGIALVNGIPLVRGIALVNNLEVDVDNGEVQEVWKDGALLNGFTITRGIALVNEVALVNGTDLNDGPALVNGIVLTNEFGDGDGEDVVSLENMNFLTSDIALTNGSIRTVRGIALVNGIEGVDGQALNIAAGTIQPDGTIVYESATPTIRGIALVNGGAYVRGIALVNDGPITSGTPIVNGSTEEDDGFEGTILVFDATDIGGPAENVSFTPMSFITGTTAGQHWIVPGSFISNNFDITYGLGTLTIDPVPLTITADDKSKTYGEADPDLTYTATGLLGEDVISGELIREEGEAAGDYAILQGSLTAGDNYTITFNPATMTIDPATLNIIADPQTKTYGTTDPALTYTVSGLVGEDVLTGGLTRVAGEDVESYEIQLGTLSAGDNYTILYTSALLTIDPATLNIIADPQTKTYGTTDPVLTYTVSGLVGEDALTGELSRLEGENVGSYEIQLGSLTAGDNYTIDYTSDLLTIDPATLTIIADPKTKTYGLADPPLTYSESGLVGAEALTGELTRVGGENVGSYEILLGSLTAGGNYTIVYTSAQLTIDPATLNIIADPKTKTYGLADPPLTYSESGLVGAETLTGELTRVGGENVGSYEILLGSLTAGENYTIVYTSAQLTIDPATLTIIADPKTKTYGLADPPLTYSAFGLVGLDALSGELTREAGDNVGSYEIQLGSLTAGENYTIVYTSAQLTIDPATLSITAHPKTKTYGIADPPLTYSDVGLVGTDALTGGLTRLEGEDVGSYEIQLGSLTAGGNYTINYTSAQLTIDPANLTITAHSKTKVYGYFDPDLTYTTVGLVSGDIIGGELSREGGENVGVYAILQGSLDAGANYTTYFIPAELTITQRMVFVTPVVPFTCINEGDPLPLFAFDYDGWVEGDMGNEGYTVLRETDGIAYDPASDESAGTYIVTPVPTNDNYTYSIETGIMHVNPFGPGTSAVKPELNCVERIDDIYIANLEYKNDNDAAVYIPVGVDNMLTGSGIVWPAGQELPTMFMPEGGSFYVHFDGTELSWIVNSLGEDHKVSNAANANSNSTKCKKNQKSATIFGANDDGELDPDQLLVYPNPVTDKVHLTMKDIEHYKMIQLYDFVGRVHPITSIDKRSNNLEIDMAQLAAGNYFIKVVMEDSTRVVKLIKK